MKKKFLLFILTLPLGVFAQSIGPSGAQSPGEPQPKIYLLNSGFRISETCLGDVWQNPIERASQEAISKGLACLDTMPGDQARSHAKRIRKLFRDPRVSPLLKCEKLPGSFLARASIPQDEKIPYIEINTSAEQEPLDGTIFHELFHNIGYVHDIKGAEYGYTCGECCFSYGSNSQRRLACELCQTPKESARSLNYEYKLMRFYAGNHRAKFSTARLIDFLKKNPKSKSARAFLRSHIADAYPSLISAAESNQALANYLNDMYRSVDDLLERPELTYTQVMPPINHIPEFELDGKATAGLIELYSAIEELGQPTEKVTLVYIETK